MIRDDNLNHYCENIIKSPLPIICRKKIVKMILIIYLIIQAFTCYKLKVYRYEKMDEIRLRLKEPTVYLANSSSFNGTFHGQEVVELPESGANLTQYFHDKNVTNESMNSTTNSSNYVFTEDDVYLEPLVGSASSTFLMLCAFFICYFVSCIRDQSMYVCAVLYSNLIEMKTVQQCKKDRAKYKQQGRKLDSFSEDVLKFVLTLKEQSSVHKFYNKVRLCWKPRTSVFNFTYPFVDCTLVDYMHSNLNYKRGFQILGAIEFLYEVMKGIDFLHYRNSYHLDLRSENVKLHCNGRKVYVKLTNFNYMKKSVDKKVHSASVGLKKFYRPPECAYEQEVDAEMCDMWGLGMIALDLFTGGLYRIKSESEEWSQQRCEDLISSSLQCSSFCAAVEATYGILDMFIHARFNSTAQLSLRKDGDRKIIFTVPRYPYKSYKVSHSNLLYNIRSFVLRLLIDSPRRRMTLQRAFNEPLIKRRKFSPN